jgi:hypothetical protein
MKCNYISGRDIGRKSRLRNRKITALSFFIPKALLKKTL